MNQAVLDSWRHPEKKRSSQRAGTRRIKAAPAPQTEIILQPDDVAEKIQLLSLLYFEM